MLAMVTKFKLKLLLKFPDLQYIDPTTGNLIQAIKSLQAITQKETECKYCLTAISKQYAGQYSLLTSLTMGIVATHVQAFTCSKNWGPKS